MKADYIGKNYFEYKQFVINELKTVIYNRDKEAEVREKYRFHDEDDDFDLYFDLVVLNNTGNNEGDRQGENILHVYEICSEYAYQKSLEYMVERMSSYEEYVDADITLAYVKVVRNGTMLVQRSLDQLRKDIKKSGKKRKIADAPVPIKELSEYIEQIDSICGKTDAGLRFFFRGQPGHYDPVPGLFRNGKARIEEILYLEAIRRCPNEFSEDARTFDNLVKMQHYNLPTRLLDITLNPLVALYFACQEEKDENGHEVDGEVLVYSLLQEQIKYFDSDEICVLSNLAKRPKEFDPSDPKRWKNLINDVKKDRPNYRNVMKNTVKDVLCVLPKLNNDRIVNQYGAFFIFGMGDTKEQAATLHNVPDVIKINKDDKKRILESLLLMGINESALFPETDKIMQQIRREYYVDVKVNQAKGTPG